MTDICSHCGQEYDDEDWDERRYHDMGMCD